MEDPYGRAEFDPWGDAFSDSDDEVEDGDHLTLGTRLALSVR